MQWTFFIIKVDPNKIKFGIDNTYGASANAMFDVCSGRLWLQVAVSKIIMDQWITLEERRNRIVNVKTR